ncbi:hypothetical protein C8R43DRAFT_968210 [Mycena crocata]|nr:hypothetical protein C8R43DRAFT_968210 [Mycena crocata]
MRPDIDLTVTITYQGSKARIATPEEAVPVVREDLTALSVPHPKRINVSVVFAGTVRFFWTAQPYSAIHKTLIGLRYKGRELLDSLSIERIELRESEAVPQLNTPRPSYWKHEQPNDPRLSPWKPDVGLYAVPMGASQQSSTPGWNAKQPEDARMSLQEPHSEEPTWKSDPRHRNQNAPAFSGNVKSEPSDPPIPPPQQHPRAHYSPNPDEMQIDPPLPSSSSSTGPRRIDRHRYASIPRGPQDAEVNGLRRELREVRRQLDEDIIAERSLLKQLRELGVEEPEAADTVGGDIGMRVRLENVERELQAERARRRRLEEEVRDVRRECREPFVVPALLDAFLEISKLTTEALEGEDG